MDSISNYRCHTTKCSCPKKLVWKSFLDTILQSRSLCSGWLFKWTWLCTINWSSNQVTQKHLQISRKKLALTNQSHKLLLCSRKYTFLCQSAWKKINQKFQPSNLLCTKGTSSYPLCFEYFSQLFSILNWFRNVYIISSCFERWWCNKTGQACNLEIILVKTGVRSVWFDNFLLLCKVNYSICTSFIYFNHFKKIVLLVYPFKFPLDLWSFFAFITAADFVYIFESNESCKKHSAQRW